MISRRSLLSEESNGGKKAKLLCSSSVYHMFSLLEAYCRYRGGGGGGGRRRWRRRRAVVGIYVSVLCKEAAYEQTPVFAGAGEANIGDFIFSCKSAAVILYRDSCVARKARRGFLLFCYFIPNPAPSHTHTHTHTHTCSQIYRSGHSCPCQQLAG